MYDHIIVIVIVIIMSIMMLRTRKSIKGAAEPSHDVSITYKGNQYNIESNNELYLLDIIDLLKCRNILDLSGKYDDRIHTNAKYTCIIDDKKYYNSIKHRVNVLSTKQLEYSYELYDLLYINSIANHDRLIDVALPHIQSGGFIAANREVTRDDILSIGSVCRDHDCMYISQRMRPMLFDEKESYRKYASKDDVKWPINKKWDTVNDSEIIAYNIDAPDRANDSMSFGCIYVGYDEYQLWKKQKITLNPPIVVDTVGRILVVRDDLLPGGTKQRGGSIIKDIKNDEIIYAGPWNGFAQVALAIACKMYNKKATIFMSRDDYKTNIRARQYGANIMKMHNANLKTLQEAAQKYASQSGGYLMPFGFDDEKFKKILETSIVSALPPNLPRSFNKTIWVVAGSATLANVLANVFPHAKFNLVQVGKTIWPDQIDTNRMKVLIAKEKFYDVATHLPPYVSAETYDAKLWQYAQYADDGDLIWNVAGHIN